MVFLFLPVVPGASASGRAFQQGVQHHPGQHCDHYDYDDDEPYPYKGKQEPDKDAHKGQHHGNGHPQGAERKQAGGSVEKAPLD